VSRAKGLLASLFALLSYPVNAFAWGYEAHRIIAEIAEQFLQPQTVRQVRDLPRLGRRLLSLDKIRLFKTSHRFSTLYFVLARAAVARRI
jgi:hypothetical protein